MDTCIRIDGLAKRYGQRRILTGLELEVPHGQVFGLLGPNGSGKTTTLACLLGIRRADQGRLSVLGLDPIARRTTLFRRVGVQFQDPAWPEKLKVREACRVHDRIHRLAKGKTEETAGLFGLDDRYDALVSALSGGERQRLALVLALAHQPQAVFLDELTTGLDPEARHIVWNHLRRINEQGTTIFLTSHSMEEVEALCQRIAILRKGGFSFLGSPDQLRQETAAATLEQAYLAHLKKENAA